MKQQQTEKQIYYKRDQKIKQKLAVLDRKYSKMIELRKDKLEAKKEKECQRVYNKFSKLRDIELHNLTSKRQKKIPEDKTIWKVKSKALKEIQKYAKLSRAYIFWWVIMIFLYDKQISVVLDKKVNWWHVFSQRNYPQLAFDIRNIRPISSWGNRKQLDTTAERIVNIPDKDQEYLKQKSIKKLDKNTIRDRKFYIEIIEKYKKLNEIEEKRLLIS